ncbi:MAG: chorismate lyase [Kangiellaceae bacterium]|nr:chorismate lyase [Kangiellaceae bacterium]
MDFTHWRSADDQALQQLPYHIAEWLAEFGSLTEKLARHVKQVKLQVLQENSQAAETEEEALLNLDQGTEARIREVILHGPKQPWIFARTIMPDSASHLIDSLGDKPLGSILFSGSHLRRQFLQVKQLEKKDWLYQRAQSFVAEQDRLWARRSLWANNENKQIAMLVCEVFLPDSPLY